MSIAVSAAALLLLTGDSGQTAPRPQTPPATQAAPRTTAPAAPAGDLTRNLNSGPPRPAEYLAPPPEADEDEDEAPARSAPVRPAATAPATTRPTTAAPASTLPSTAAAPSNTRPAATPPAATSTTPRPPAAAPSTTRPSTTAPAPAAPATTRSPTPAPTTTRPATTTPTPSARPATAAPAAAAPPAAPGVTVLDAVARDGLPFSVELPEGFEIVTGRPGPDFRIYTIRRGGRSFAMVYTGPASQFPIYSGEVVEAGGRASVIASEDGQRRALEHLFQRPDAPREVHVWTMSLEGADRALAERIAQSVDIK